MYWNNPLTFANNLASKEEKYLMGFCLHDSMMQFHQTQWNGVWDQFHDIRAQPAWLWLNKREAFCFPDYIPESKAHGANMGPTWDLSAPDGPHVGPINLVIRDYIECIPWHRHMALLCFVLLCFVVLYTLYVCITEIRANIWLPQIAQVLLKQPRRTWIKTRQIWGIWKLRLAYSPETPNLGQNRWCFVPCDLEIWRMTLENHRSSFLCCFKLCATFHSH